MRCPKVQQTLVVGVPDPRLVKEVCACIIPHPGQSLAEDELRKLCDESLLGNNCSPRYYLIVEEFPRSSLGKSDRRTLASLSAAKLGLGKGF